MWLSTVRSIGGSAVDAPDCAEEFLVAAFLVGYSVLRWPLRAKTIS